MNLGAALIAFAVVFPAELPDKSLFASLVLGTRYRPLAVWVGVTAAFAVHVALAVTAGGLLHLLPRRPVQLAVAVLFLLGAGLLYRESRRSEPSEPSGEPAPVVPGGVHPSAARGVLASFGLVFLGEWGDITQLATANLAARYHPVPVAVGAFAALTTVAALAVVLGRTLTRRLPTRLIQRACAALLAALGVLTLVTLG
ncbi:MAG: TMEM165/GDT1 family protein [Mycobacteriales bacterium]